MFGFNKVSTDENKIEEALTRGVAEVINKDSLKDKLLSGKQLRVKLGIDPTSPNLHVGRSIPILKLKDFQDLGHEIILIVGDATGVIGDTSDKESERPMLSQDEVIDNARNYFRQASIILGHNFEKKHNSEWLDNLSFSKLGELANQFSVADFIARDNIRRRLDAGKRVSLREMLYPLMQGYDSVHVKADIEIGGTDQRFNLLAGRTLQEYFGQEPQDIITNDLIPGIGGGETKMSSSQTTSAYKINFTDTPDDMFGKVMRLSDEHIQIYFTHATRVPINEIENIMKEHPKDAKMRLAREIVTLYHGEQKAATAERNFTEAFSKGGVPDAIQVIYVQKGTLLPKAMAQENIVSSKTEFRRLVQAGSVTNLETQEKISDVQFKIEEDMTLRVGKHRFVKIEVK